MDSILSTLHLSTDVLYVFAVVFGILALAYLWMTTPPKKGMPIPLVPPRPVVMPMSTEELRKNNGKEGAAMYIAVKGDVFDVGSHPSGREMYGQESPYRVFVGRDASIGLAMMSTNPTEWKRHIDDLTTDEVQVLDDWYARYMAKYTHIAHLTDGQWADREKSKTEKK